jgi:hypothetical protein
MDGLLRWFVSSVPSPCRLVVWGHGDGEPGSRFVVDDVLLYGRTWKPVPNAHYLVQHVLCGSTLIAHEKSQEGSKGRYAFTGGGREWALAKPGEIGLTSTERAAERIH